MGKENKIILGYQVSSLKPLLTTQQEVAVAFKKLADIGYRDVQLQWIDPSVPDQVVAEQLQESGLRCVAVQDMIPAVRENPERYLKQNLLWGSQYMTVSGIPAEYMSVEGIKEYSRKLEAMAKPYQEQGIIFAFHPITQSFAEIKGVSAVCRLLEQLPEEIQLTLCVHHAEFAGYSSVELMQQYQGRVDMIHLKDYVLDTVGKRVLVPVGQGITPWKEIIRGAESAQVKWAMIEQESWEKDAFLCAKEAYDYAVDCGLSAT